MKAIVMFIIRVDIAESFSDRAQLLSAAFVWV